MVYLDYAANCPVEKKVLEDFNLNSILYYANPNSTHKLGIEAKEKIDSVSEYLSNLFNVKSDNIIYTSGATESNNLVIKGFAYANKDCHIITTEIEHSSIIAPCNYLLKEGYNIDILSVNEKGQIDLNELESLITDKKTLVSITSVESETGIMQNIEEISELLKKYDNVYFHTDLTQGIGKINIDSSNIDMITFAPHKFYGINGIGILIKKDNVKLLPIINGGKSTSKYRSGTPATALILSIKKTLEIALANMDNNKKHITKLNEHLREELKKYENVLFNSPSSSIPNILNISVRNMNAEKFSKKLQEKDIYISTKSACSSEENISKIIYALTKDKNLASSSLRISLSHMTTKEEIDEFLKVFDQIYNEFI